MSTETQNTKKVIFAGFELLWEGEILMRPNMESAINSGSVVIEELGKGLSSTSEQSSYIYQLHLQGSISSNSGEFDLSLPKVFELNGLNYQGAITSYSSGPGYVMLKGKSKDEDGAIWIDEFVTTIHFNNSTTDSDYNVTFDFSM